MTFVTKFLNQLPGFIIGVLSTLTITFGSGFIKEFFDERTRTAKHKRNVAREVHKIINEASSGNYRKAPRDIEYANGVLTDLDGVDEKMGICMNSFVNLWNRIIGASKQTEQSERGEKYLINMLNEIEINRKELSTWANKLRAGK